MTLPLHIDPLHVGVTVGAISGTVTALGAYVLDADPIAVGAGVAAVCGGLAAVLTAIGGLVVAMSTNRNVKTMVSLTDNVVSKQDDAAKQTAEIHSATNGTLSKLNENIARLEEQLKASVATVADRDVTIAKAAEVKPAAPPASAPVAVAPVAAPGKVVVAMDQPVDTKVVVAVEGELIPTKDEKKK